MVAPAKQGRGPKKGYKRCRVKWCCANVMCRAWFMRDPGGTEFCPSCFKCLARRMSSPKDAKLFVECRKIEAAYQRSKRVAQADAQRGVPPERRKRANLQLRLREEQVALGRAKPERINPLVAERSLDMGGGGPSGKKGGPRSGGGE